MAWVVKMSVMLAVRQRSTRLAPAFSMGPLPPKNLCPCLSLPPLQHRLRPQGQRLHHARRGIQTRSPAGKSQQKIITFLEPSTHFGVEQTGAQETPRWGNSARKPQHGCKVAGSPSSDRILPSPTRHLQHRWLLPSPARLQPHLIDPTVSQG